MRALMETAFTSRRSTLLPLSFDTPWTRTDLVFSNSWPPELVGAPLTADNAALLASLGVSGAYGTLSGGASPIAAGGPPPGIGDPVVNAILSKLSKLQVSNGSRIPIPPTISGGTALVQASTNRNLLLIQNNSAPATTADVAPTLLVNFDGPVSGDPTLFLNLVPGQGILLDQKVPNNAIYVAWTSGTGNFTWGGVCMTGYTPGD